MPIWMIGLLVTGAIAAGLCGLYFFLVWPGEPTGRKDWVRRWKYAHRGLFTHDQHVPENSLAAFAAAVAAGYGVELDVAMTKDRKLVVFHDDELSRMCGRAGKIWDFLYDEISDLPLADTAERIPLFTEVLELIDGHIPVIVELKSSPLRNELCEAAAMLLDRYDGLYCVESFDPVIVRWFRRHRPEFLRGQLASRGRSRKLASRLQWFILRYLLTNAFTRPHFIAYAVEESSNLSFRLCKKLGALCVAWTVRDSAGLELARKRYDALIFESWEGMSE